MSKKQVDQELIHNVEQLLTRMRELNANENAQHIVLLAAFISVNTSPDHRKMLEAVKQLMLLEIDIQIVADEWPDLLTDGL